MVPHEGATAARLCGAARASALPALRLQLRPLRASEREHAARDVCITDTRNSFKNTPRYKNCTSANYVCRVCTLYSQIRGRTDVGILSFTLRATHHPKGSRTPADGGHRGCLKAESSPPKPNVPKPKPYWPSHFAQGRRARTHTERQTVCSFPPSHCPHTHHTPGDDHPCPRSTRGGTNSFSSSRGVDSFAG